MSPPLLLLLPALHAADPDAYSATWTGAVPLGGDALEGRKYADPDCGERSPGELVDLGPEGIGRCDLAVQALAKAELAERRALIGGVCARAPCSADLADLALGCTGGANSALGTSCQLTLLTRGAPVATYAIDSYMHIEQVVVLSGGRLDLERPQPGRPTMLTLQGSARGR